MPAAVQGNNLWAPMQLLIDCKCNGSALHVSTTQAVPADSVSSLFRPQAAYGQGMPRLLHAILHCMVHTQHCFETNLPSQYLNPNRPITCKVAWSMRDIATISAAAWYWRTSQP